MNRLFLDEAEIADASGRVVLPGSDRRAKHVREVLWRGATAPPNAKLRVGVLDGGVAECSASVCGDGIALALEGAVETLRAPAPRPRLHVVLAIPAPLRLKRIVPAIASLGVDSLWLTGSHKGERAYFGAQLLKSLRGAPGRGSHPAHYKHPPPEAVAAQSESELRALLIEAAEQSGDPALPRVALTRSLKAALVGATEYAVRAAGGDAQAVLKCAAHPDRGPGHQTFDDELGVLVDSPRAQRLGDLLGTRQAQRREGGANEPTHAVLVVGPDRGFDEPAELQLLQDQGFGLLTLGARTLRTDVALLSLVALLHDRLDLDPISSAK